MNRALIFVVVLCSCAAIVEGQTAVPQQQFAFRFELSRSFGDSTNCLSVLPDGHYRREMVSVHPDFTKRMSTRRESTTAYVYEGHFSLQEMNELGALVNTSEFRAIEEPARLPMSSEFFFAFIVRKGQPTAQKFRIGGADDYKPYRAAVKPLFAWWNTLDERKRDLVKGGEPNGCKLPSRIEFLAKP